MSFSLTILGSSSALPTSRRFTTAHILNMHERFFLIDCGEGTQIQLRKYKCKLAKINHIFISHLHGDHYFGIFGLISTFHLLNRQHPLHIFAHPDLEEIVNFQLKYVNNEMPFQMVFHTLDYNTPQILVEDEKITVTSFPLKHRIPTCGFLFEEKPKQANIRKEMISRYSIPIREIVKIKEGADFTTDEGLFIKNRDLTIPSPKPKSYAFCSDTMYFEKIIDTIKNVDLLYHEATFMDDFAEQARLTMHSTAPQAATIAKLAQVGKLLIGHFSSRYKDTDKILQEAQTVFPNTVVAVEGKVIQIAEH